MKEQRSFLKTFTGAEEHVAVSDEELIVTGAAMVVPVLSHRFIVMKVCRATKFRGRDDLPRGG